MLSKRIFTLHSDNCLCFGCGLDLAHIFKSMVPRQKDMDERSRSAARPLHIPSLDGIRAMSVVTVFFSHAVAFVPGMLGVTAFFFLSGYLITTLLRFELANAGTISLRSFYVRRSIRIFPMLYLALGIDVLLQYVHYLPGTILASSIIAEASFLTNYFMIIREQAIGPGLDVLWSLAVEEHFYLLFPVAYILLARRMSPRRLATVLLVLCGLVLLWRCTLHFPLHAAVLRTRLGSDTRIDSILFGSVMAVIANPITGDSIASKLFERRKLLLPLALCVLFIDALWHSAGFRETIRYTLDGLALFICFIWAILAKRSVGFRFLNWQPVRFMGKLSYSFYLFHHMLLIFAVKFIPFGKSVQVGTAFALTFALSCGTFYAVERPLAKLRGALLFRRLHAKAVALQ